MKNNKWLIAGLLTFAVGILIYLLTACGGSGGSGGDIAPVPPPAPPPQVAPPGALAPTHGAWLWAAPNADPFILYVKQDTITGCLDFPTIGYLTSITLRLYDEAGTVGALIDLMGTPMSGCSNGIARYEVDNNFCVGQIWCSRAPAWVQLEIYSSMGLWWRGYAVAGVMP